MSDAKARVWAEIMELVDKRSRLEAFMASPAFDALGEQARALLYTQNRIMESYEMVLRMRYLGWDE